MYIECRRTKKLLFMTDDEKEFLLDLIPILDDNRNTTEFLRDNLNTSSCLEVASLIKDNIEANKIFECRTSGKISPVVVTDNLTKPKGYQPLSMDMLSFLSEFATFVGDAKYGIKINN